jgi:hypothetical protein
MHFQSSTDSVSILNRNGKSSIKLLDDISFKNLNVKQKAKRKL